MDNKEQSYVLWRDVLVEEEVVVVESSLAFPVFTKTSWTATLEGRLYPRGNTVKMSRSGESANEAGRYLKEAVKEQGWVILSDKD